MPATLADTSTIEQRIAALVEQHRADLEQLVDAALDRQLDTLVAERIAARNGADTTTSNRDAPTRKLCTSCGERPAQLGRRVCPRCRAARARERRARAASPVGDELPHPASIA